MVSTYQPEYPRSPHCPQTSTSKASLEIISRSSKSIRPGGILSQVSGRMLLKMCILVLFRELGSTGKTWHPSVREWTGKMWSVSTVG